MASRLAGSLRSQQTRGVIRGANGDRSASFNSLNPFNRHYQIFGNAARSSLQPRRYRFTMATEGPARPR